jgi:hypothetical protein
MISVLYLFYVDFLFLFVNNYHVNLGDDMVRVDLKINCRVRVKAHEEDSCLANAKC